MLQCVSRECHHSYVGSQVNSGISSWNFRFRPFSRLLKNSVFDPQGGAYQVQSPQSSVDPLRRMTRCVETTLSKPPCSATFRRRNECPPSIPCEPFVRWSIRCSNSCRPSSTCYTPTAVVPRLPPRSCCGRSCCKCSTPSAASGC
jgi:hypothetical protein